MSTLADEERSRADDAQKSPDRQLVSTPRPRHRSASPRDGLRVAAGGGPGCPARGRRLTAEMQTADCARRRYNSMSASTMSRPTIAVRTAADVAPRRLRVSRDATQPATGSMRSLRSSSQDSEETDEFPDRSFPGAGIGGFPVCGRPRAATCPESKAFRRRARVRSFNRPPTPTPTPTGTDTDSPAATIDLEGDDECVSGAAQRLADFRLNVGYTRDPGNGGRVTKSPSLGSCGADLPAISESQ